MDVDLGVSPSCARGRAMRCNCEAFIETIEKNYIEIIFFAGADKKGFPLLSLTALPRSKIFLLLYHTSDNKAQKQDILLSKTNFTISESNAILTQHVKALSGLLKKRIVFCKFVIA